MSSPPVDPAAVFSVRIVSLDYYTAPPIPDLDFCYTEYQGRKVEEVPVIRIFGSTPAGQKACLHVHRALPYLYIPYPDDLVYNTEKGNAYLRVLSRAIEKALSNKSTLSKTQHVHGCSLVWAKKFYGFHPSEELFIKIYLYYPHEVSRVATLLLSGDILNRAFQPYESHIPFLLQFMVDYNLYGMNHIHTSKFKFRLPIPDAFNPKEAFYRKHDPNSTSDEVRQPTIWLSSTVPGALILLDSVTQDDYVEDNSVHLIKRQSICGLELDASVDDILNEKCKLYTSLSQTESDVKMVQSLIPIWEEYERSRVEEVVKSPDSSKPPPEVVLKRILNVFEYENAFLELCLQAQESSPSGICEIGEEKGSDKYTKSSTGCDNIRMELQRPSGAYGDHFNFPGEEHKNVLLSPGMQSEENKYDMPHEKCKFQRLVSIDRKILSSEIVGTEDQKCPENEALGLLNWLASSQAVEDLSIDDELAPEAILSPLFQTKSYKEALEIANLDYETASQQECQDILDSIGVLKSERLNEKASSDDNGDMVSCGPTNDLPQVNGSFDSNYKTPKKDIPEGHLNSERESSSEPYAGKYIAKGLSRKCEKTLKKRILLGSLHLSNKEIKPFHFERTSLSSSLDMEMKNDCDSSSSSSSKGRYCNTDMEIPGEKVDKLSASSVRDLMRRKRRFRTEHSESEKEVVNVLAEVQENEMLAYYQEGTVKHSVESVRQYSGTGEATHKSSLIDENGIKGSICVNMCSHGVHTEGYGRSEQFLESHIVPTDNQGFHRGSDGDCINTSAGLLNFAPQSLLPQVESDKLKREKFPKLLMGCHSEASKHSRHSGCHKEKWTSASMSNKKYATFDFPSGCQPMKSCVSVDNFDERLKSCPSDDYIVDEHALVNEALYPNSLATVCAKHPFLSEARKHTNKKVGQVTQERLPERYYNVLAASTCELYRSNMQNKNDTNKLDALTASSNPECEAWKVSSKVRNPVECIETAFIRKPPSRNEVCNISESPRAAGHVWGTANNCSVHDFPPFFEEWQASKYSLCEENLNIHHEFSLGIPCHFQNDGSVLYLLTHVKSPPTSNCVHQWLSEVGPHSYMNDAAGSNKMKMPSSFDRRLKDNSGLGSSGHAYYEVSSELEVCLGLKPELSSSSQENSKIRGSADCSSHVDIVLGETKDTSAHVKDNAVGNIWQDTSQISGPNVKSNPTPLSQIGFLDPASVGGGQQLTSISIEVLAESRGDLRPDPQFDAINIICLAIQEDVSPSVEVYVLARANNDEPSQRKVNGANDFKFFAAPEEILLLDHFVKIISSIDPDILLGWEIQRGSLGFLAERAAHLGIGLLKNISRAPPCERKQGVRDPGNSKSCDVLSESSNVAIVLEDIIEDDWGRTHASGIHVGGRIVLNVWRLMRSEIKLNMYSVEAVAEEVLKRKIPSIPCKVLNHWFSSGPGRARYRSIEYVIGKTKLNFQIVLQLDLVNRTSELARVFGIDFFSVLSRGSQFRVESMLLRLAHTQNYLAISPGSQQVAAQPAMECLPLVMEPESGFYVDPVVVLDFQSLYPSMIIAYNLCFSTCLGKVVPLNGNVLGVSSYSLEPQFLMDMKQDILLAPNGVMYVPSKVRKGVLPRLLDELLSTRIMIKQAMKKLTPSQQVLQRIFNARQLALKLIANVTYGYTAAGFSGRMPCAELADSIVQCGRRTLETAITFVNEHDKWKAKVIYGDTDSMFVLLKGRSLEDAFVIGKEIASLITAMNPIPVTLKLEKVYNPCFLLTKKRYVGYSYESPNQDKPKFDAKGIETVRRDTCQAVAKTLEQSIRLIFEHRDIHEVKAYLNRQWTRIISGKISLQDFVFAKEVRLGTYSANASSLPPSAIVAAKSMRRDPRAKPQYGERIPYIVIHGEPGARLMDMVIDPSELLDINSPYRLNDLYYINKQIIPALQRVFGLLGADLNQWFVEMPRPPRTSLAKRHLSVSNSGSLHESDDKRVGISKAKIKSSRIDTYYGSKHCTLCGELVQVSAFLCDKCSKNESLSVALMVGRTSKLEREIQHLAAICRHCGGGDWILESGVKCTSLACSVFYERRKVQKELKAVSSIANEAGYYPSCTAEWF